MNDLLYILLVACLAPLLSMGITYFSEFVGKSLLTQWGINDEGKLRNWSVWAGIMFLVLAVIASLSLRYFWPLPVH